MGEFFKLKSEPRHRCELPRGYYPTNQGWRCDCGLAYKYRTDFGHDVQPGDPPGQWERLKDFDRA